MQSEDSWDQNIRAGLIPFLVSNGKMYVCLMQPSNSEYGGDRFQLAKGHIDEGEADKDCAVREAIEELGLIRESIGKLFHITDVKKISWWSAEYKNFELGHHTDESKDVKWVEIDEAFDIIREWQRPILSRFVFKVKPMYPELFLSGNY
jgi:8-oxo-dGTP pyrophosphatase MutT (NUDIX family)